MSNSRRPDRQVQPEADDDMSVPSDTLHRDGHPAMTLLGLEPLAVAEAWRLQQQRPFQNIPRYMKNFQQVAGPYATSYYRGPAQNQTLPGSAGVGPSAAPQAMSPTQPFTAVVGYRAVANTFPPQVASHQDAIGNFALMASHGSRVENPVQERERVYGPDLPGDWILCSKEVRQVLFNPEPHEHQMCREMCLQPDFHTPEAMRLSFSTTFARLNREFMKLTLVTCAGMRQYHTNVGMKYYWAPNSGPLAGFTSVVFESPEAFGIDRFMDEILPEFLYDLGRNGVTVRWTTGTHLQPEVATALLARGFREEPVRKLWEAQEQDEDTGAKFQPTIAMFLRLRYTPGRPRPFHIPVEILCVDEDELELAEVFVTLLMMKSDEDNKNKAGGRAIGAAKSGNSIDYTKTKEENAKLRVEKWEKEQLKSQMKTQRMKLWINILKRAVQHDHGALSGEDRLKLFMAVTNDECVGVCMVWYDEMHYRGDGRGTALLVALYVLPNWRVEDLASHMLEIVKRRAVNDGHWMMMAAGTAGSDSAELHNLGFKPAGVVHRFVWKPDTEPQQAQQPGQQNQGAGYGNEEAVNRPFSRARLPGGSLERYLSLADDHDVLGHLVDATFGSAPLHDHDGTTFGSTPRHDDT